MKRLRNILTVVLLALGMLLPATVRAENTVDVKEIVFGHIGVLTNGTSRRGAKLTLRFLCR